MAESGTPVEVLKPGEEWSLVRLGNGTEGYLLSRYLTATAPARFRLDQLQEKNKTLNAQAAASLKKTTASKPKMKNSPPRFPPARRRLPLCMGSSMPFGRRWPM